MEEASNSNAAGKKRRMKFVKKANAGNINTLQNFVDIIEMNVYAKASFSIVKDVTRKSCLHDLNTQELRDVLMCLINDDTPPKYFSIQNKGCIRNVVYVHVPDCDDKNALVDICSEFNSPAYHVTGNGAAFATPAAALADLKISKNNEEICLLPHKLLSVEMDMSTEDSEVPPVREGKELDPNSMSSLMLPYVLNEMQCRTWSYPLPVLNTNRNSNLSDEPMSKRSKPNGLEEASSVKMTNASVALTPEQYISSLDRMTVQIGNDVYGDFIETRSLKFIRASLGAGEDDSSKIPNIVAIDCEMVETVGGVELARVSVVDENSTVLYDTYVQPSHKVLDYRTEFSGITPEVLEGVETTLVDVQYNLLTRFISQETLLIGHSLENDLKTLRLIHRFGCIDTSILYPHAKGFPYRNKLKYLSNEYLKSKIQQNQAKGHDSVEDAVCAMKLVLLKVENGPSFGQKRKQNSTNSAIMMNNSNIICCENINQHGEVNIQRIPIVGASYQQHSIPVGYFFNSEKEGKEYMSHCYPQGSVVYIPTGNGNACASTASCGMELNIAVDKRTAGFEPRNDTTILLDKLKDFVNGLYLENGHPIDEARARAIKSLSYISCPYVDQTSLREFLLNIRAVYNENNVCRYNESGVTNTISKDNYSNTLIIVTRQANLRPLIDLANKKRVCIKNKNSNKLTVASWSRELETQLKEMIKINNNDGQCMTWMC